MIHVGLLVGSPCIAAALECSIRALGLGVAERIERIGDLTDGRFDSALIHLSPELDENGTLAGFYLLRDLFLDPPEFTGPVALLGDAPRLFNDPRVVLPNNSGITYYPVPFEVRAVFSFLRSQARFDRRAVRMLLGRKRFDSPFVGKFLERLAVGDEHAIQHFQWVLTDIPLFLEGRSDAFSGPPGSTAGRQTIYSLAGLGAQGLVDGLEAHLLSVSTNGMRNETGASVRRLREAASFLYDIGKMIDQIAQGRPVLGSREHEMRRIIELKGGKAQVEHLAATWKCEWRRVALALTGRAQVA